MLKLFGVEIFFISNIRSSAFSREFIVSKASLCNFTRLDSSVHPLSCVGGACETGNRANPRFDSHIHGDTSLESIFTALRSGVWERGFEFLYCCHPLLTTDYHMYIRLSTKCSCQVCSLCAKKGKAIWKMITIFPSISLDSSLSMLLFSITSVDSNSRRYEEKSTHMNSVNRAVESSSETERKKRCGDSQSHKYVKKGLRRVR